MATRTKRTRSSLIGADYQWTVSASGTNEYYVEAAGGGDPSLSEPAGITNEGVTMSVGTVGSLANGEWDWGDNDTLGFSTVYVRTESTPIVTDPIVEYYFNDGSGSTAADSSGNGNTGTIVDPLWDTTRVEGSHSQFFDGAGDSLSASAIGLTVTGALSVSAHVDSDGSIVGGPICRIGTATDYISLHVTSDNLRLTRVTASSTVYAINWTGAPDLDTAKFYHVALVAVPGQDAALYVDGAKYTDINTVSGTYDNSVVMSGLTDNLTIGSGASGDLEAAIDIFRIWNKGISDADVTALAAETDRGVDPDTLGNDGIVQILDTSVSFDRTLIDGAPSVVKRDHSDDVTIADTDFSATLLAANEGRLGFRLDNESGEDFYWVESDTEPTETADMMLLATGENYFSSPQDGVKKLWGYQASGGNIDIKVAEIT